MLFVDGLGKSTHVDTLLEVPLAEEMFEIGPKLSVSGLRLYRELYRAERDGDTMIGAPLSRRYLQATAWRITQESTAYTHHPAVPANSPHYVEAGTPIDHAAREALAVGILSFLATFKPPGTHGEIPAPSD